MTEDPRIEAVAHILCMQHGEDPHKPVRSLDCFLAGNKGEEIKWYAQWLDYETEAAALIAAADAAAWRPIEQTKLGDMGLIYGGVIIDPSDGPVGPHHISMGWLTDDGWKIDGGLFVSGPEKFRHITSPQEESGQ